MSRDLPTSRHRVLVPFLALLALLALLAAGPLGAQTCPTGSDGVAVGLIDADGDGVPDLPGAKQRTEHARVSTALRDALGLAVDPASDVNPQVRVVVDTPALPSGGVSTAVFTVVDVFADTAEKLEVYDREDSDDEKSGYFKLFESRDVADLSTVCVTVHAQAPSATSTSIDGAAATSVQHFAEPNAEHGFTETVRRHDDRRFALLVPHGGDIEEGTSEQVETMRQVLEDSHGVDLNLWQTGGTWFGGDYESEHWHITSKAVSPAGFPGLAALLADPPFDASRAVRYAVSLHGFGIYQGKGLVLGGRAHREAKCLLASRIQQRLAAEGRGAVAFYIWDLDGDDGNNIDLPDARNIEITQERPDVGLSGRDPDNIVNRLSPSDGTSVAFGGFQVEESRPLRDDPVYRDLVAQEIGHAIAQLIADPSAIDPAGTAVCDALVAAQTPPTGSISGRLWHDQDGDHLEDAGEPGASGAVVTLLDASSAPLASFVTGGDGAYTFGSLAAGDYRLRFTPPSGFELVDQDEDDGTPTSDERDSDADPASGETALLALADGEQRADVDAGLVPGPSVPCHDAALVAFGSSWRTSPGFVDGWLEPGFGDGGWDRGPGTLGYGTDVETETDELGTTSYFRLAFEVADPSLFDTLDLVLLRDDGAVVYLNGLEVMRSNLPAGTVDDQTTALGSSRALDATTVPASYLATGTNVLAVEVHERAGSSNPDDDLIFDLELSARVCRPCVFAATVDADRGTFLEAGSDREEGDEETIEMDGSPVKHGLFGWDLSGLPTGAEVLHAEIEVWVDDDTSSSFRLYPLLRSWNEAEAHWFRAEAGSPDVGWFADGATDGENDYDGATPLGIVHLPDQDLLGTIVLNVDGRARVASWLADPSSNHGVLVPGDDGQGGLDVLSDDDALLPPRLKLVYATGCGQ